MGRWEWGRSEGGRGQEGMDHTLGRSVVSTRWFRPDDDWEISERGRVRPMTAVELCIHT